MSVKEILEAYPELEEEDIGQALHHAAWAFFRKRQDLFRERCYAIDMG
jgi:uncharacterized protein (DUF433 family)